MSHHLSVQQGQEPSRVALGVLVLVGYLFETWAFVEDDLVEICDLEDIPWLAEPLVISHCPPRQILANLGFSILSKAGIVG